MIAAPSAAGADSSPPVAESGSVAASASVGRVGFGGGGGLGVVVVVIAASGGDETKNDERAENAMTCAQGFPLWTTTLVGLTHN